MAKPVARLPEQFLTMGQEEEPRTTAGERLAREVKGRNQGLAGSGRSDDEVPKEPSVDPLRLQPIERGLLVRMRAQIEENRWASVRVPRCPSGVFERELHTAAGLFIVWPESLKFLIAPERVERCPKPIHNVGCLNFAQLDGPFNAVFQSGSGQVGRAHIHTAEAVIPLEKPGFGVQPATASIQRDSELHIGQPCQFLNGPEIGSADVGRGEELDWHLALGQIVERALESLPTAPLDETHHHENAVGGRQFALEFETEPRFIERIHQQGGGAQRGGGRHGRRRTAINRPQELARRIDGIRFGRIFTLGPHELQQRVRQFDLSLLPVFGSASREGRT